MYSTHRKDAQMYVSDGSLSFTSHSVLPATHFFNLTRNELSVTLLPSHKASLHFGQIICIWSSWCHCYLIISCFIKTKND